MPYRLGVVMDPIEGITPYKDTTLAMLLEAQRRGWEIRYLTLADLSLRDGVAYGDGALLEVRDDNHDWYTLGERDEEPLENLDAILMRKDPPVDSAYVYATQILAIGAAQRPGKALDRAVSAVLHPHRGRDEGRTAQGLYQRPGTRRAQAPARHGR
jgi:glutathione synthase